MNKTIQILSLCCLLIVLAIGAILTFEHTSGSKDASVSELNILDSKPNENTDEASAKNSAQQSNDVVDLKDNIYAGMTKGYQDDWCRADELTSLANDIAILEHENWEKSRGYFSVRDRIAYKNYEPSLLLTLGQQGDLLALDELVWRSLENQNQQMADKALHTAIVSGSSQAFIYIASNHFLASDLYTRDQNQSDARQELITALAYLEVAAIRNDLRGLEYGIKQLRDRGIQELTEDELSEINTEAKEIYAELERERSELAMPSFDNSIPKTLARHNDLRSANFLLEGWSGWGSQYINQNDCVETNIEILKPRFEEMVRLTTPIGSSM